MRFVIYVETDDEKTDPEEVAEMVNKYLVDETETGMWSVRLFSEQQEPE